MTGYLPLELVNFSNFFFLACQVNWYLFNLPTNLLVSWLETVGKKFQPRPTFYWLFLNLRKQRFTISFMEALAQPQLWWCRWHSCKIYMYVSILSSTAWWIDVWIAEGREELRCGMVSVYPYGLTEQVIGWLSLLLSCLVFFKNTQPSFSGVLLLFSQAWSLWEGNSLEWWPSGIHHGPAHVFQLRTEWC